MDTLVVNLFGGPGVSKSTNAALVFGKLKSAGVNAEIAHEYAKDLTWEERHKTIRYQPYVIAKQMWRVHRLLGQVDVVITDSPILLGLVYQGEGYSDLFGAWVLETFKSWKTLNIRLQRNSDFHLYNPAGRTQNESEAQRLDDKIEAMLKTYQIPYQEIKVLPNEQTAAAIFDAVDVKIR